MSEPDVPASHETPAFAPRRVVPAGRNSRSKRPQRAEDYAMNVGTMTKGSQIDIQDDAALGDVVLCGGSFDRSGQTDCYAEYRVQIPRKARWTLWARVRYPTGGDMSFGLVLPDEKVTLSGRQVLGNCGVNDKRWHWTGRGGGVTTVPPGSPIVFDLEPGPFVFRVYPREGGGTSSTNPRLDCFCLSEDPDCPSLQPNRKSVDIERSSLENQSSVARLRNTTEIRPSFNRVANGPRGRVQFVGHWG